ncbi:MAG TPA: hypothetical protein VGE66_06325 [Chitinophagaceae bacterium]
MKAASIAELKTELKRVPQAELIETVLRLARYKKENKELLSFLLFEADDLAGYIQSVQKEIEDGFDEINTANMHWAKKGVRKVLRLTNKHIRYTGSKVAETELLIHFCRNLKGSGIKLAKSPQLANLYAAQVKKIRAAIATMHEDLQYDYISQLEELE